uniref:Uncharacterized protein n=1 Tax=Leersia perrieri TaxID=77586 RepID=A0A0D9XJT8_9ORYZ
MAVTPPLPPHDRCKGSIERAGHARSAPRGAEGRLGLKSVGGGRRRSRAAGIRGELLLLLLPLLSTVLWLYVYARKEESGLWSQRYAVFKDFSSSCSTSS